jgi:hypothetical protein
LTTKIEKKPLLPEHELLVVALKLFIGGLDDVKSILTGPARVQIP